MLSQPGTITAIAVPLRIATSGSGTEHCNAHGYCRTFPINRVNLNAYRLSLTTVRVRSWVIYGFLAD
jgi:hypothetical protein